MGVLNPGSRQSYNLPNDRVVAMRLGGWHRVGIVLSVLWAIGAGFYQRNADIGAADKLSQVAYNVCTDSEHIRQQRDPNYSGDCIRQAMGAYGISLYGSWGNVALVALAPIPIAWALVYLVLAVMRWIGAGFRIRRAR